MTDEVKTILILSVVGALLGCAVFFVRYFKTDATKSDDGTIMYTTSGKDIELSIDSGTCSLGSFSPSWYANDINIAFEPDSPEVDVELRLPKELTGGPFTESTSCLAVYIEGTLHTPIVTTFPFVYQGTLTGDIKTVGKYQGYLQNYIEQINVPLELHILSQDEFNNYENRLKEDALSISLLFRSAGWGLLVGFVFGLSTIAKR